MGNKYGEMRYKWLAEKGFNVLADKHQYAYTQSLFSPTDIVQGVFCEAAAGTGKTTIALLCGVYEMELGTYDRIIYVRNAIPLRDQGFLPGDMKEKSLPYFSPAIEALDNVQPGYYEIHSEGEEPKIICSTTAFTRGITWKNAFVVIDEAQSFDLEELQAVYTRCADSCKIVTTGSVKQVDNRKIKRYGGLLPFEVYMKHFEGTNTTFHKLQTNYRGNFSNHADEIMKTVKVLQEENK